MQVHAVLSPNENPDSLIKRFRKSASSSGLWRVIQYQRILQKKPSGRKQKVAAIKREEYREIRRKEKMYN